ncbi:MAG TPA: hypothetical protein VGP68_09655 [Gemmataceae bacterium]|nr:hypothetical protein [Gemmataceae bacterium]
MWRRKLHTKLELIDLDMQPKESLWWRYLRRSKHMAENNHSPDRLDMIESRLRRLEEGIDRGPTRESAVETWQYLVRRQHPWRKQLYLKGRNMTARQFVGSMRANQLDEAAAAADFRLPVEAVREALA